MSFETIKADHKLQSLVIYGNKMHYKRSDSLQETWCFEETAGKEQSHVT